MMSFSIRYRHIQHILITERTASASTVPNTVRAEKHAYYNPKYKSKGIYMKRISPYFPCRIRASMTVEAAMALSFFLFFMINLLSLITMYETYSDNLALVAGEARQEACASFEPSGNDLVTRTVEQKIEPIVGIIAFNPAVTYVSMSYRKWNGYDVCGGWSEADSEEYVYITPNGSVYHRSLNCSHLNISIKSIEASQLSVCRNKYGKIYKPCEKCQAVSAGLLFITEEGDKYHSSASCSGLKRTVKTIKLSQAGGRPPCSDCAK